MIESKNDINKAYNLISDSKVRNEMIIEDVRSCVNKKQTPVILTRFKDHAKYLYDGLKNMAVRSMIRRCGKILHARNNAFIDHP